MNEILFKQKPLLSNEDLVLEIFKNYPNQPLSFHLLRFLTGMDQGQLWRLLNKLQKYGLIRRITKKEISLFFVFCGEDNGDDKNETY